ncbi:hypothetical protein GCM10010404_01880 [Nonomuraea africana]|uniref:DUF4097 and DUF4098 domain-containing protein YvlB n=1 Tax=Nonomuraea africana TaxID=46171 RepID=A0ABR9KBP9_9ACTN|nr:DUF4097 family beta strand repeat-containing protein [Nonomuraea africana]MBE1559432.1 DUF4097 and DUF4098 domain-containing protein YvlB [Nonomuraea africana]
MKRKGVIALGALVLSGTALTGCGFVGMGRASDEKTETYEVSDKVAGLDVMSGAGDVVVNEVDRTGIKVTEKRHWRDREPKTSHEVKGDTLELAYSCESGDSCWVDYTIEVPKGLRVKSDTGSGDLTLRSLTGEVEAKAGAGTIDGNGLGAKRVVAESGSGSLELKFAGAPDDVEVTVGSGDATLHLPRGSYDVTAEVGAGDAEVKVTDDPGSPRKIIIRSGAGNVKVLPG